jgi:signal transduction histidine kinase/DNA-binding response OmpR family regulator
MRLKLLLSFFIILAAVVTIGYFGQSTINTLIESIRRESQPSARLGLLRQLQADLVEIENSVRTFTITRDPDDLTTYYRTISSVEQKMNRLHSLAIDAQDTSAVENIGALIDQKLEVLNRIIGMSDDDRVGEVLLRVQKELEAFEQAEQDSIFRSGADGSEAEEKRTLTTSAADTAKGTAAKQRFGFFRKLFGPKKPAAEQNTVEEPAGDAYAADTNVLDLSGSVAAMPPELYDSATLHTDSMAVTANDPDSALLDATVEQIIDRIETEEQQIRAARAAAELRLIREDKAISDRIRTNIQNLEHREERRSMARAATAEKTVSKTRDIVLYTTVAAIVLFLLLLIIIFNDIARSNRQKKALREARDQTERLARTRQEFLSNVSHEIRTPLHAIMGFAEQLKGSRLGAIQEEHLEKILHSSGHLMLLINDILDLSKIESGKLVLDKRSFSPAEEIDGIVNLMQPEAIRKRLDLHVHTETLRGIVLFGDPFRYRQILINLVSNAIKFSEENQHVEIRAETQQEKNHVVLLTSVKDKGIGIPEEKLTAIFDYFYQTDSGHTRHFGGTGLGLSIVKNLVDIHRGSIEVHSSPGKGSTFAVKIPYEAGSEQDMLEQHAAETTPIMQKPSARILGVDDQTYNLELLAAMLRDTGALVDTVTSGREALDRLGRHRYDAVLLDIQMPGISGLEVIDIYKKAHPRSSTSFIAVTADTEATLAQRLKESGFSAVLTKPFSKASLYQVLESFVPGGPPAIQKADQQPKEDMEKPYNLQELKDLSEGNVDFVISMLELFVKNTEETLQELKKAIDSNEFDAGAALAHKAVPPCRHLNITGMVDKLKLIETTCRQHLEGIPGMNYQALEYEWKYVRDLLLQDIQHIKKSRVQDRENRSK